MSYNPTSPSSATVNLPIITHLVGVYKLWHEYLPHIAKTSRYTLGTRIDALLIETAESIFVAGYLAKDLKLPHVQRAVAKLDLVKFFLQISWEIRALDNKKYALLSERLYEIGKMLGGWTRQLSPRETSAPRA